MEPIKGRRLTNRESLDMGIQDYDIPVIPPLRIKLEPANDRSALKKWLEDFLSQEEHVEIVKMHAGGDIVHGLCCDEWSYISESNEE